MKNQMMAIWAGAAVLAGLGGVQAQGPGAKVDPQMKSYERTSGVSGNLNSIGSDTLNNLMTLWAEGFQVIYPNVKIQIEGKGSSTAPPALIEGTAQLGPMSRPMKGTEIDAFEKRYGYKPVEVKVAIDALAIFVHKDNPLQSLTIEQADSIFSSTRRRGAPAINRWADLKVQGPLASRPLSLYGRNSASGTYGFFKDAVLNGGDYKATVKEQPGSSSVVQGIGADLAGIGYSGIGYQTSGVKALPLGTGRGQAFEPSPANCLSGKYPLARFLYIYVNVKPGESPSPLIAEFLKFVLSKEGQEVVVKDGYFPLPTAAVEQEVKRLGAK